MLDKDFFNGRIIILDGAMGTMLQRYGLAEEDFHTDIIDSQAVRELKGNNECLNLSHPEIIREIHLEYIKAGGGHHREQYFQCQQDIPEGIRNRGFGLQNGL